MIRAAAGALALLIAADCASAAVEQRAAKALSAKAEAQIARLMHWMTEHNEDKTFSAEFRSQLIEKLKEKPAELIADPAIHCLKHSSDTEQFKICLRSAYKPSQ